MQDVFDLVQAINQKISQHHDQTGRKPRSVSVSPNSYRRLLEIKAWEERFGNLIIGCFPITLIATARGSLPLLIDELLPDTTVEVH
ncbi:MAG TPA: hypothetical protein DCP63_15655 [Bacteroidetes bacterium]|nr:hypothetical protein [Bacteroidota bacterium]